MSENSNGINSELAKKYFASDDECVEKLLALQMTYMAECREIREAQKRNFKMGVAEGLPKEGFLLELKLHRMKHKHAKQVANLLDEEDEETIETAEMIREALGAFADTPMGRSAIEKAAKAKPDKPAPKARGRKKKGDGEAVDTSAAAKEAALESIDDSVPEETDVRPPFLRQKDADAAAANAAAIEAGIKPLH